MKFLSYSFFEAVPIDTIDGFVEECLKEELHKGTLIRIDEIPNAEDLEIRNSEVKLLDADKYGELFKLVWKYALESNKNAYGFDISNIENCQFSVYDSSYKGKYDWHTDTSWANESLYDRKISLIIQLSDPSEYEGGQFEVKDVALVEEERELMNKKGSIITIPAFIEHRVTPVTKGRRLSLIAWIEGTKFR